MSTRIDNARRCYVLFDGPRVVELDFSTITANANALAGYLRMPTVAIPPIEVGLPSALEKYNALVAKALERGLDWWVDPRTAKDASIALRSGMATGRKLRVFYGDPSTGQDECATVGTIGYVDTSNSGLPTPILKPARNARNGWPVRTLALVRIADVEGQCTLWEHPQYTPPPLTRLDEGFASVVYAGPTPIARCSSASLAGKVIAFLRGASHQPPPLGVMA